MKVQQMIIGLVLVISMQQASLANQCSTKMPKGSISICLKQENCSSPVSKTDLQEAFDYIALVTNRNKKAYLTLSEGWYTNKLGRVPMSRMFLQINWRQCRYKYAESGFQLKGRTATTKITGVTGNPGKVKIWARVPYQVANNKSNIFHGLSLVDNSGVVTLANLSIVSDGGWRANGAGDASLYAKNTIVMLHDSYVFANKTTSNPLRDSGNVNDHDQEGIVADGGHVMARKSAIAGNIHTGVMALNGGSTSVEDSIVASNGWDGGHFQTNHIGHGITSFYDEVNTSCYNGNTEINIHGSLVRDNSGEGVMIRGHFNYYRGQEIALNQISGNSGAAVNINGGWGGGETEFKNYSPLEIFDNKLTGNSQNFYFVDYTTDATSSIINYDNYYYTLYSKYTETNQLHNNLKNLYNNDFSVNADRECYKN